MRFVRLLGEHLLVRGETRLALRLPARGAILTHFELALERLLGARTRSSLPAGGGSSSAPATTCSCLPRDARAAVELEDPARDVVEEVAVVRHGDDRALVPCRWRSSHATDSASRMVGRFVEQQQVGLQSSSGSATRRRSPPDFDPRRRPRAGSEGRHGDLELASRSQVAGVHRVRRLPCLLDELVHRRRHSSIGSANFR